MKRAFYVPMMFCLSLMMLFSMSITSVLGQLPQRDYGRHPGRNGALTEEELQVARRAWKYFERNYQDTTGLVNAVDKYPSTTMWDIGAYMAALVSVREMGIITQELFDYRITKMFATFQKISLFRDELPNKCYNTITAQKVNYGNQPMEIGFSAIDLARFLLWSKIIKERYPQHSERIDNFILRWSFKNVIDSVGILYGGSLEESKDKKEKDGKPKMVVKYLQEGRLGYEEYSAKCFQLWGFETAMAAKPEPFETRTIYGIEIPYDTRDPRELGAHNYVVSESYVLDGIELNWDSGFDYTSRDDQHTDPVIADFAQRIYKVQEERFKRTGIMTARTEHQLDGDPYFVYDAIFTDGYPWNTITETGKHVPKYSAVALKGALGLWSLWQTKYTDSLFNYIKNAYDPEKGYYEGIFERKGNDLIKTFTMNNNGIMLETLLYKMQGKLLRFSGKDSKWDKTIRDREEPKNSYIYDRLRKPFTGTSGATSN